MILDIMGAPPAEIKSMKTEEEIIHLFNEVYALAIMGKYETTDIRKFETIMKNELQSLNVKLDMRHKEKAWYVLLCMLMRHHLNTLQTCEYAVQVLEQFIGYSDKYKFSEFRENVVNIYWIIVSRDEGFAIVPRMSMMDEPLSYIESSLHLALFNSKNQMINSLKKNVPIRKIHTDTLNSYFGSIELKNKDDYVAAMYDIIYTVCMNNMTNGGADIFDFDSEDPEEIDRFTNSIFGNIGESLNEFINDVNLVSSCTSLLAEILLNNLEKVLS